MSRRAKTGGKDSEISSKNSAALAPLPEVGLELPEDLERLRSALLADMTQAINSLLKRELEVALSPVNTSLEQVKSYYEWHDEHIREVEDGLNDQSDRLVSAENAIATLQSENT